MWLYFELMICDKYRGKNTGPQCVNIKLKTSLALAEYWTIWCSWVRNTTLAESIFCNDLVQYMLTKN
jgi:hypothetical protein